tara:strand:- start:6 stop:395 length:390 start_codon:yes stop_codon:yes gene_type:complete
LIKVELLEENIKGIIEILIEFILDGDGSGSESGDGIFFLDGNSGFDKWKKFLGNSLDLWGNKFFFGTVHEVGDGRGTMSRNSWNWIREGINKSWKDSLSKFRLEIFSHIITDLTNAMKGSISNSWVLML